jgi:gliding motility-associated-like protein
VLLRCEDICAGFAKFTVKPFAMKHKLLGVFIAFLALQSHAQTVIWTETFTNGCASDCDAAAYVGPNGAWTVTNSGVNGADANTWYVSGAECGNAAGVCGTACGATDPSLHVSSAQSFLGDLGAAYGAGGLGFWFVQTDKRAESPTIDMSGQSNLTLNFNYIENGQLAIDNAEVWYFDGATWALLQDMPKTTICGGQGMWTAVSVALPASANNNANMKIGFRWYNNDDNVGTDPSFAVDDIEITTPSTAAPVADFTASPTTVCTGQTVTFTNTSTTSGAVTYAWNFGTGATPATASTAGPHVVTYNTAGTANVTLTVTDANGTDNTSQTITVNQTPTVSASASPSVSICSGDPVTLTGGGATTYSWTGGVTNGVAFTPASTTTYTVTGTTNGCSDTETIMVTVNNCGVPTASFNASSTNICVGQSVTFTDASTGTGLNAWSWTFTGGSPASASTQGPHSVTYNTAGTYTVSLTVTDANGTDDTIATNLIVVNAPPTVTANASSSTICSGDPVTLTGGGASTYSWSGGVTNGVPFTPASTATYTVTGTDANGCTNTANVTVTVNTCAPPVASFTPPATICEGDCLSFTDESTGTPTAWNWSFGGGTPSTATIEDPGGICFLAAGTYSITLSVTNSQGTDDTTITVTVIAPPTLDAGQDVSIVAGSTTVLTATGSGSGTYTWSPSTGLSATTGATVTASPTSTTQYTVTYTEGGCTATDDVIVDVILVEAFGVPTAFSPNGDNVNDVFRPRGSGIQGYQMTIFNRYGQLVFETKVFTDGWDGTHNGKELNPGVFAYVITYNFFGQESETVKGNLTLVK